jgi:GrpB-like predicted nucleotidyltransferase (UPF0157 family)
LSAPSTSALEIVAYRCSWPLEFAVIRDRLRTALGMQALRIEHVGSTSVSGLAAKDIIDVQVSVASLNDSIAQALSAAGCRREPAITGDHVPPGAPASADDWRKLFFFEAAGERRANIHVRRAGSPNERYALLFRDYLRAHPVVAAAYAELKRRLSRALAVVDDYADVKDPAVDLIYLAAEQWASASSWVLGQTEDGRMQDAVPVMLDHAGKGQHRAGVPAVRATTTVQRTGQCVCGAIRFVCVGEPERVTICHCLWCQRRTGTAFGTEVVFQQQNVVFSGIAASTYRHTSDESGRWLEVYFCPRCGCNLGFTLEAAPGVRTLPAGTFDDPTFLNARALRFRHVFARTRRVWGDLTSDVEVYERHFRP